MLPAMLLLPLVLGAPLSTHTTSRSLTANDTLPSDPPDAAAGAALEAKVLAAKTEPPEEPAPLSTTSAPSRSLAALVPSSTAARKGVGDATHPPGKNETSHRSVDRLLAEAMQKATRKPAVMRTVMNAFRGMVARTKQNERADRAAQRSRLQAMGNATTSNTTALKNAEEDAGVEARVAEFVQHFRRVHLGRNPSAAQKEKIRVLHDKRKGGTRAAALLVGTTTGRSVGPSASLVPGRRHHHAAASLLQTDEPSFKSVVGRRAVNANLASAGTCKSVTDLASVRCCKVDNPGVSLCPLESHSKAAAFPVWAFSSVWSIAGAYCTPGSSDESSNIGKYENGGVDDATAACSADPSCDGFTMRQSKTQYILKSTVSGTNSASGFDCYQMQRRASGVTGVDDATLSQAEDGCAAYNGGGYRLCTADELTQKGAVSTPSQASSTGAKGSGCGHDSRWVWSSSTCYMALSYTGDADENTCPLPVPADCAHAKLYHVEDDTGSFDELEECTETPLSHDAGVCDSDSCHRN